MSHPPPPSDSFLAADRVTPRDDSYPAPGHTIPLTFLDTHCIILPYVQPLLLYPETNGLPFHLVVQNLKSALSETLLKFHPLAGKLTYVPSTGDVVVDCSDAGVEFVVAESDGDIKRLAGDPVHDLRAFIDLVPEIDRSSLPLPVMAVKVTGFAGGGVAVGLAVHHTVVDGNGSMQFLQAWSACCRGAVGGGAVPVHDRALLRYPGGDELARECLRKNEPELPKLAAYPSSLEARLSLQRRTFTLSSAAIQSLKRHIADQTGHRLDSPPSTFTSLSAFAWVCIAHAKQPSPTSDDETNLIFFIDCRSRIDPPLPASYTGNCICGLLTTAKWSELSGSGGISRAQELIACAVREGTQNPFGGGEGLGEGFRQMQRNGMLVTGSPRFSSYQTDFGWGKPARAELVSMDSDGQVVFDGRGEGAVQVSVTLGPARMVAFATAFEDLLMSIQQDEIRIGKK